MSYRRTSLTLDHSYRELWFYRQKLLADLTAQEKKEVFPNPILDFLAFLLTCPVVFVRYFWLPIMAVNVVLFTILRWSSWQRYIPAIETVEKMIFLLWSIFLMGKLKLLFDINRIEDKSIRDEIEAQKIKKC